MYKNNTLSKYNNNTLSDNKIACETIKISTYIVTNQFSVSKEYALVDSEGNDIEDEQLGLLLYHGGTVCHEDFDDDDANRVCNIYLGYARATAWTRDESFDIQRNYLIKKGWGCDHSQDIFLSCSFDGGEFKIDDNRFF